MKQITRRRMTSEQRHAAQEFLEGLWSDPVRRAQFAAAMGVVWDDFKSSAEYERLRKQLSDAARGR